MTTFKVPNKILTILRENCLKLLHTKGSRVTYWRLPNYVQWKAFLLQSLTAKKIANYKLKKKSPQFWWLFSFLCFTQFGVLIIPIALKVVGPLLLDSNSSRDDTNPPFQFPIWQLKQGNKETSNNQRPKKEMKAKPKEFWQDKFSRMI